MALGHPLYAAALYRDLSPTRRRSLHQAAAQTVGAGSSLAHRVAAADSADDRLAADLADGARREERRGGRNLAARYLMWASSVRSDRPTAEQHLLEAGRLLILDGQTSRAAGLRDQLETCADTPQRSLVLGMLAWEQGDSARAEKWLLDAASDFDAGPSRDPVAVQALTQLGALYCTHGRGGQAIETGRLALARQPADPEIERAAWSALAIGEATAHGAPAGLARLGSGCRYRPMPSPRKTRTCSSSGGRSASTPVASPRPAPICGSPSDWPGKARQPPSCPGPTCN